MADKKEKKKKPVRMPRSLHDEGGDIMQTLAEKWKREGIKIGEKRVEKRGIEKKAIEIANNLLEMGIDIDKIAKATGLKKEKVEKLASINH